MRGRGARGARDGSGNASAPVRGDRGRLPRGQAGDASALGGQGRLELDERRGDVRVLFTPTLRADDLSLAFDIAGGGREAKPTLVVSKTVPASILWISPATGQEVRIQISWLQ